jgi:hypothetical protein
MSIPFSPKKIEIIEKAAQAASMIFYAKKGINTKIAVDELTEYVLPVKLSTKRICNNHDHCSQYHYFCEMMTNHYPVVINWANRAGSKTYLLAMINWLKSISNKGFESVILGASLEQSKRAYDAMRKFWNIGNSEAERQPLINEFCIKEPMQESTFYKNGSLNQILAASDKSARGPHPNLLNLDEIDAMDSDILETALSQPQEKNGIPSQVYISSTNHVMGGNMDAQIEKLKADNPEGRIFKWCIWDCLEACDGKCTSCKLSLSNLCPGKQMTKATGYYKIKDFIQKLRTLSLFTVETEWLCTKIGHPDMIYGHELKDSHYIDINYDPSRVVWLSIDWGGTNPFSVGVWQDFRNTNLRAWVRVDEIHEANTTTPKVIEKALKRPWANMVAGAVYDPSGAEQARQFRESFKSALTGGGLAMYPADNRKDVGIEAVKGALSPVLGDPMMYFSKRCNDSRREMFGYKKNSKSGRPIEVDDHGPDEIRYFTMWKINPPVKKSRSQAVRKGGSDARARR